MKGFPINPAYTMVDVFWGNRGYAVKIATCQANDAMAAAWEWFRENDHFFHLENFPPYQRFLDHGTHTVIDYGSHANFLFLIPVK